jgi:RimJ/RimL family protein N-acetyltransferase
MIKTERLNLIACEIEHFDAFDRDENELAEMLDVELTEGWLVFPEVISHSRDFLKNNPDAANWWMYFFIHAVDQKLVGNGGFKGKPDDAGTVEIGYAVAPAYRRKGLATEAAQGLIDFAFSHPQIQTVQAHTLAEENESVKVLRKVGMNFVKELNDPEDGDIWQWQLKRKV